jgi:hypothetical protein
LRRSFRPRWRRAGWFSFTRPLRGRVDARS